MSNARVAKTCFTCFTFLVNYSVRPSYLIFARRGKLQRHISLISIPPYLAKDMIENEHLLIMNTTHFCSQVGRFEYACRTCGHKAGAKRALRQHMRTVHPSLLKVCFQNKRNISCLLQESLQENQCPFCKYSTPWKDSLRHHEKQHELPEDWSQVICYHCPFFYRLSPLIPTCTCNSTCTSIFLCTCTNCKVQSNHSTNYRHDPLIPKDKRKCEQLLNQVPGLIKVLPDKK